MDINNLISLSKKLRRDSLKLFAEKGEAHVGGSFSIIEILIYLYYYKIRSNDKFILSKSHASYPMCLILRDLGFKNDITTHLELDVENGIYATTGSLGHGLPISVGYAIADHLNKLDNLTYVLISDGECQEGTTWESLLIINKFKLQNLIIIVDYNKIQALEFIENVLPLDNLIDKFKAFNCNVENVIDGHNFNEIHSKLNILINSNDILTKVLLINTIKGKGVSEFENNPIWHARKVTNLDYLSAINCLE